MNARNVYKKKVGICHRISTRKLKTFVYGAYTTLKTKHCYNNITFRGHVALHQSRNGPDKLVR